MSEGTTSNPNPSPTTSNENPAPKTEPTTENQKKESEPKKEQPKPEKKKFKLGNDLVDEDVVARDYGKWKASDERLREAAEARKAIEKFYDALENDPESVLSDPRLPIDKQKLAMKWLREQIEEETQQVDPKDKKLSEMERELNKYKSKEQQEKEAQERAEYEKGVQQRQEAIAQILNKALEMTPLSKNPKVQAETVAEMARYLQLCRRSGYDVAPEELVQHLHGNKMSSYHSLAQELDGEDLINWLGEAVVMKLRKADLAKLRKSRETPPPDTTPQEEWTSRSESGKKRNIIDPETLRRGK